jgi:hypothetical protein
VRRSPNFPLRHLPNRLKHLALVLSIQRTRTLIQNEYPRRTRERTSDLKTLGLAPGNEHRILVHHRIVILRKAHDEIVHGRLFRRHTHIDIRYLRVAVSDVVGDGGVE